MCTHAITVKIIRQEQFLKMNYLNKLINFSLIVILLRCYSRLSHSPLVFIVSDSTSGSQSSGSVTAERQLFPKDLQADLNIASIRLVVMVV